MIVRVPDYFDDFSCLAGQCPHSCCTGWEVVIDDDTVRRYLTADGPLGQRLRAAMRQDEEGDLCFPLNGGRCPFLNRENLCEIHCAWGEGATSVTCREHPRFTEDYGAFQEITLSASCPKANELLLGSHAPLAFSERTRDVPAEAGDPWLTWLMPLRDRLLDLLRDRRQPLADRLEQFLLLAQAAQAQMDRDGTVDLAALWEIPCCSPGRSADPQDFYPAACRLLSALEVLESDWPDLLARGTAAVPAGPETLLERIAVYFAFRYLPKAVNDGDLLSRAEFCVFALLVIRQLAPLCGLDEALRRFSCEIEHNDDNLEIILDALRDEETITLEILLAALAL